MGVWEDKESRREVRRGGRGEGEMKGGGRGEQRKGEKGREGERRARGGGSDVAVQASVPWCFSIGSFPRNFLLFGNPIVVASLCDARVSSLLVHAKLNGLLVQYFRVFLDLDAVASFLDLPRDETDKDFHECGVVIEAVS